MGERGAILVCLAGAPLRAWLLSEVRLTAGFPKPMQVPVEVQMRREGMRGAIAGGLLLVIAGAVAGAFAASALDWASPADLKDLLTAVYNPLVGLFGAVIGFYFGSTGQTAEAIQTTPKKRT